MDYNINRIANTMGFIQEQKHDQSEYEILSGLFIKINYTKDINSVHNSIFEFVKNHPSKIDNGRSKIPTFHFLMEMEIPTEVFEKCISVIKNQGIKLTDYLESDLIWFKHRAYIKSKLSFSEIVDKYLH